MPGPLTRTYDSDLARVAGLAEVDPAAIAGWCLFTWEPGGQVKISHNACCSAHVHDQLVWLLNHMAAVLVPCSPEQ